MPEDSLPSSPARPLLTIAVPTYNRSANLALLLGILGPRIDILPQVELLVCDNASPDDTAQVMRQLLASGLRCRYIRNPVNLGPDPNFLQCYRHAAGKYLWIFGDDDVIFPESLPRLIRLLASGDECDLIYLAPFGFLTQPNERALANPRPRAFTFTDASAFVHSVGLRGDLVLISAVILNKDRVEQHPHPDFALGVDTNLLQLEWTFAALRHFRRGLILERGIYAVCEFNPQRPFDAAWVFGVNWAAAVARHFAPGTPLHHALLNTQLYSWFPANWIGMRRNPTHTILRDPAGQLRPLYGDRLLYWICTWPLLAWPMPLALPWLALLRGFRTIDLWLNRLLRPEVLLP